MSHTDRHGRLKGEAKQRIDCQRKTTYETSRAARKAKKYLKSKRNVQVRSYNCPVCGLWHLTTREGRRGKQSRSRKPVHLTPTPSVTA
jgi:hypothetical protein